MDEGIGEGVPKKGEGVGEGVATKGCTPCMLAIQRYICTGYGIPCCEWCWEVIEREAIQCESSTSGQ